MKRLKLNPAAALLVAGITMALLIGAGCADRHEVPEMGADSTLVYPSIDPDGPSATITFCRKFGSKTGKPIGSGREFIIAEDSKVRALIEFENLPEEPPMDLMFHLVWIRPDGREFYTKRIDMAPGEVESSITASVSARPDGREPGTYRLEVYLYRELIAEKNFVLVADPEGGGGGDDDDEIGLLSPFAPGNREHS